MAGVNDTLFSPSNGVYYAARVPPNYVHESKQTEIIVGMAVIIFVMLATTGARLIFKLQGYGTRFGMDDWVIIPAVVSDSTPPVVDPESMLTLNIVSCGNLLHVTDIHGGRAGSWAAHLGKYL